MAHLFGMARLGKDAEIRTAGGDSVCNLSLAFSYYDKKAEKGRATQWVDATLWGKRADALAPYLTKGTAVAVSIEDVHIEEYQGKNGAGHKLVGRVVSIELGGGKQEGAAVAPAARAAAPAPRPAPAPAPRPAGGGGGPAGLDDMGEDIPFAFADHSPEQVTRLDRRMRRYNP